MSCECSTGAEKGKREISCPHPTLSERERSSFAAALTCGVVCALALGVFAPVFAQAPASSTPTAATQLPPVDGTAAKAPPAEKSLFSVIKQGGLLMVPLFLCSFVTLVFVFERSISLRRGRVIPAPFVKRFMHQLREGKLDREEALEQCRESSSAVAEVFTAAVRKWGRPSVELEQGIIDAEERAASTLRRYIRLFNGVATLGPLLGLLGTVFGMIHVFHEIATSDAMGRAEMLAGGISEAMLTTATGLCVAIPALCFYLYFVGRVDRLIGEIDKIAQELVSEISAEALQEDRMARSPRVKHRGTAA